MDFPELILWPTWSGVGKNMTWPGTQSFLSQFQGSSCLTKTRDHLLSLNSANLKVKWTPINLSGESLEDVESPGFRHIPSYVHSDWSIPSHFWTYYYAHASVLQKCNTNRVGFCGSERRGYEKMITLERFSHTRERWRQPKIFNSTAIDTWIIHAWHASFE